MNRPRLRTARKHWIARDLPGVWYGVYHRALGAILLIAFAPLLPHTSQLFGVSGLFDTALLRLHPHGAGISIYDVTILLERHVGLPPDATVYTLSVCYLTSCFALAVSWQTQRAAAVLMSLHYLFFIAVPVYSYGFDYLCLSALFYCALYHTRRATLILRLLQLHLCVVYLFGGLNKIIGSTWHNGEALWKAVQQPIGGPLIHVTEWLPLPWLWATLGWGVVVAELSYAMLIWWRPVRPWILGFIVLMHTGIALVLGLYAFSALMILLNLTAFYYPYLNESSCQPLAVTVQAAVHAGEVVHNEGGTPKQKTSSTTTGVSPAKPP